MNSADIKYKVSNFCPTCNSIVESGVIFSYLCDVTHTDENTNEGKEITLSKCLNCENPFLIEEHFLFIEGNSYPNNKIQLYPFEENQALKNAPDIVIRPYTEATKCYRAQAYDACVIMCRKGIEAICNDKGVTKGNLADKLNALNESKILEDTLFNWANELRLIGNDGAHSHEQIVTQLDAKDSLDFLDSLITYLYHLVNKYDKLKSRRNSSKA